LNRGFSAVREGLPWVIGLWVAAAAGAVIFWPVAVCLALIGAAILLFFRDPRRVTPSDEGILVAPVDGRVVHVQQPGEDDETGLIAVFMSLLDVHVARSPCSGTVREVRHVPGRYNHAASDSAALMNEHVCLELDCNGATVTVRLIAGMIARRIVCILEPGDAVVQGQKIGMIRFGSRVEVTVPQGWQAQVVGRERVRGGVTVIGTAQ